MDIRKRKQSTIKIVFVLFVMVVISLIVILIKNEEHYAKKRAYSVEKIVVKLIYDGNGNYCLEGYDAKTISDKSEVKKWREMLYDVDTKGRWFSFEDGPPGWDVFFMIEVYYQDGYVETIECTTSTRAFKYMGYKGSYALGSSKKLYSWCYDLFFDEPNPNLPEK